MHDLYDINNLDSCPFCGKTVILKYPKKSNIIRNWEIYCPRCQVKFQFLQTGLQNTFDKWNTRKPLWEMMKKTKELQENNDKLTKEVTISSTDIIDCVFSFLGHIKKGEKQ